MKRFIKLTEQAISLEGTEGRHFEAVQKFLQAEECTTKMAEQLFALYKMELNRKNEQIVKEQNKDMGSVMLPANHLAKA